MPKTKEQFEKIKQERMNEILNHSLYLFALHGYDGVTTDEIAKAVGCSHGLLYHYFGSKEDLFQEVVNNVAIKIDETITKDVFAVPPELTKSVAPSPTDTTSAVPPEKIAM